MIRMLYAIATTPLWCLKSCRVEPGRLCRAACYCGRQIAAIAAKAPTSCDWAMASPRRPVPQCSAAEAGPGDQLGGGTLRKMPDKRMRAAPDSGAALRFEPGLFW